MAKQTNEQILEQLLKEGGLEKKAGVKEYIQQELITSKALSAAVKGGLAKGVSAAPSQELKESGASVTSLSTSVNELKKSIDVVKTNTKETNTILKSLLKITETNFENTKEQFNKLLEINDNLRTDLGESTREAKVTAKAETEAAAVPEPEQKSQSERSGFGLSDLFGFGGRGKGRSKTSVPRSRLGKAWGAAKSIGKAGALGAAGTFIGSQIYRSIAPDWMQDYVSADTAGLITGGATSLGSLGLDYMGYKASQEAAGIGTNTAKVAESAESAASKIPGKIVGQNASMVADAAKKGPGLLSKTFSLGKSLLKNPLVGRLGGGLLTAGMAGYEGYQKFQDINAAVAAGEITEEEASKQKVEASTETAGGAGGALAGAAAGASLGALGGPLAPVTVPLGALAGGFLGSEAGGWAGKKVGQASNWLYDKTTAVGDALRGVGGKIEGAVSPLSMMGPIGGIASLGSYLYGKGRETFQYDKDIHGDIGKEGGVTADQLVSSNRSLEVLKEGDTVSDKFQEGMSTTKVDPIFGTKALGAFLTAKGGESDRFMGISHEDSRFKDFSGSRTSGGLFGEDSYNVHLDGQDIGLEKAQYFQIKELVDQGKIEDAYEMVRKVQERKGPQFDRETGAALTGHEAATRNWAEDSGIAQQIPLDQLQASRSGLIDKMKPQEESSKAPVIINKGGDTVNNITNSSGASSGGAGSPSRIPNPWDNLTIGNTWSPI